MPVPGRCRRHSSGQRSALSVLSQLYQRQPGSPKAAMGTPAARRSTPNLQQSQCRASSDRELPSQAVKRGGFRILMSEVPRRVLQHQKRDCDHDDSLFISAASPPGGDPAGSSAPRGAVSNCILAANAIFAATGHPVGCCIVGICWEWVILTCCKRRLMNQRPLIHRFVESARFATRRPRYPFFSPPASSRSRT